MIKETPNPSKPASTFPYGDYAPEKLQQAGDRALDFYLKPEDSEPESKSSTQLFIVADSVDTEVLLANLSETLASANAMLSDLAFDLDGSRRHVALGVAQMIELGALLADKALDRVELRA
ncbi:hypothetical protein FGE05_11795 [Pseudomonas sp. ICMP22404]|uniref:DUF6124 family protein n=1 Tax=Pseudomonas sp. ICMP22404 TaxID=2583807 RepID=UPI001119F570|nr:DUF6124 family protein [Pseudomonas sp. ICMP22404]TNF82982.1 hypothetical protein FGE05_11795 [Pseudomonas sp. ICMP22404]